MNGNASIANLLFTRKEQPGTIAPAPLPGPDSSFHKALETNLARREPEPIARSLNEKPRAPEIHSETRSNHRDGERISREDKRVQEKSSARSSKDNAPNDDARKTEAKTGDNTQEPDNKVHEEAAAETTHRPAHDKDVSLDKKDSTDKAKAQTRYQSFWNEPATVEQTGINASEEGHFLHDVLSMSLAAGKQSLKEIMARPTAEPSDQSSPKKTKHTADAKTVPDTGEAASIRTTESMLANLVQDGKILGTDNSQKKSTSKLSAKEELAQEPSKGKAKEPVVTVNLDETKWKVAGDVAREARVPANEPKLDNEPSKYAKTNARTQAARSGEIRMSNAETIRDANAPDTRVGIDAPDIRREASFEVKRAAAEQKTHLADNRKAFNELVEKARLNLGPDGRSSASIRLNPAHLGRMTINLQMNQNHLQAKVLVENQEARRMLMDDMEFLQKEMRIHGIQIESFSVRVREPQSAQDATNHHAQNKDSNATAEDSKDENSNNDSEQGNKSRNGNSNGINDDAFETVQTERKDASLVNISV